MTVRLVVFLVKKNIRINETKINLSIFTFHINRKLSYFKKLLYQVDADLS